ncbi:MAG TPA: thrombospondin type 3 repeat-containing protein [Kofleriaceae bacterium]|nr:thrombospondin type 3 repeat-containing protein [Kofleriaceae bacterium]
MRAWFYLLLAGCSFQHGALPDQDGGRRDGSATSPDGMRDGTIAATDTDGDGITDGSDNCPALANADQANEDGDGPGDVCDNCPHMVNADQANADADGVGDVCDPRPGTADHIVLFLPFNSANDIAGWTGAGTNNTFVVTGGALEQQGTTDLAILWKNGLGYTDQWVTTRVTYNTINNGQQFRGVAIMSDFERSTDFGHGGGCGEMRDSVFMGGVAFRNAVIYNGSGFNNVSGGTSQADVAGGHSQVYRTRIAGDGTLECLVGTSTYTRTIGAQSGTGINFSVWGATAKFDYLIVID